jgi:hypothetical protein
VGGGASIGWKIQLIATFIVSHFIVQYRISRLSLQDNIASDSISRPDPCTHLKLTRLLHLTLLHLILSSFAHCVTTPPTTSLKRQESEMPTYHRPSHEPIPRAKSTSSLRFEEIRKRAISRSFVEPRRDAVEDLCAGVGRRDGCGVELPV